MSYTAPPPKSQFGYDQTVNEGSREDFLNRLIQAIYPGAQNSAFFTSSWGQPASQQSTLDMFDLLTPEGAKARAKQYGNAQMENAQTYGKQQASGLASRGYSQAAQEGAMLDATNQARTKSSDYAAQVSDPFTLAQGRYQVAQQAGVSPATQLFAQLLGAGGSVQSQPGGPSLFESLLGAAGIYAGAGGKFSDRRLKQDVVRVGAHKSGVGLYEYTIGGRRERGVMADEVEKVRPDAVGVHSSGYKTVDYDKLGGL